MSESNLWTDVILRFGCRFLPACSLLSRRHSFIAEGGSLFGMRRSSGHAWYPFIYLSKPAPCSLRNFLRAEARRAHLNPDPNEPLRLLERFDRPNDRPADVLIPNFIAGRDTCIDVSIVSSFTDIANAALASGYNARRAEELKRDRYEAQGDQLHMSFVPFVILVKWDVH